ncbi:sulfotransferase family protein, partial [Sphingomonas bacterium]|uniref:sulfotransferase family protein n=1 Tax=Sphingomonas bacterium TaxID=1895847 RepID=UPI00157704AE
AARGEAADARDALTRLLRDRRLTGDQRAEALLLLGLVLDDLGEGAEAFAAACEGKRMQRDLHAVEAASREDEVTKLHRLASWIDACSAGWRPLDVPIIPEAAASHVFLLGFPRSGTTLLEHVLSGDPQIATLEEAPTLATAYQAFLSDAGACADLMRVDAGEAEAWAGHYWGEVRRRGVDVAGRLFVDKQPAGTLYLPIIARLFPRAKILFALRDPRDVVLSCFRQAFRINAMTYAFTDLARTAACYDACMTLAERARASLPLSWMDVRHEALVDDFDAELGRILAFLDREPHPAMADFAARARERTIRTPSARQVRMGLNRRGLGRWEQYRRELAPILPTLAPWLARFGYPP